MATLCSVVGSIATGDAVCVTGWDGLLGRPEVARASRSNLATSKTVFGVAKTVTGTDVSVLVAGEVADGPLTGLDVGAGAGTSFVVATDVNAATAADQCRLIRVERPDGSEYVVGTCDEGGNLAIQPRASRDTSARLMFNVRSYGVTGAGSDETAISAAASAAAASTGAILHFPSGTYVTSPGSTLTVPANVQVFFDEGATLEPNGASVTLEGRILAHPNQTLFGGTGFRSAVTPSGAGLPVVTISGEPARDYDFVVAIDAGNSSLFRYSLDGGTSYFPAPPAAALTLPVGSIFAFPATGITAAFPAGIYVAGSSYTWSTRRAVSVGPASFPSFNVINFGAVPYDAHFAHRDRPFRRIAITEIGSSRSERSDVSLRLWMIGSRLASRVSGPPC
ncbi:MAG: hypothetical protein IPK71_12840 [Myxococcales bacterium]|nr:hypothetical protein [Myxococcales bacterium]